ncbi:MAG TPA: hypothetical protein VJM53_08750, partial [Burkholderiales bacterium]|nr:hypothetical protein [Burkholderiales bacterium]
RLKSFIDGLAEVSASLQQTRSPAQWKNWAERVLARFYLFDEIENRDVQTLRSAMQRLCDYADRAAFKDAIPYAVWFSKLEALLERESGGQEFYNGGITFASLRPLRAIPARFVAVLGLNDKEYPRQAARLGFDLMEDAAQRGDRIPRDEDRYAFLDVLLATREQLHLSYTGRSLRDDAELPPSPVLAEFLDALSRCTGMNSGSPEWRERVIEHPLQPFSARYFDGRAPHLYSYSNEYIPADAQLVPNAFIAEPLSFSTEVESEINLEALESFLRNPARYFLRQRLGLRLVESEDEVEENEPFGLKGLAQWTLCNAVLKDKLESLELVQSRARARAAGYLPHGVFGDVLHARFFGQMQVIAEAIRRTGPLRVQPFETPMGFSGVARITETGEQLVWQPGKLRDRHLLVQWIRHLALNAGGFKCATHIHALGDKGGVRTQRLLPVENAQAVLGGMVDLMHQALSEPLAFFPKASRTYVEACLKDVGQAQALKAARYEWEGNQRQQGEGVDPYFALAFRGRDPFAGDFAELALSLYMPLLEAMRDG